MGSGPKRFSKDEKTGSGGSRRLEIEVPASKPGGSGGSRRLEIEVPVSKPGGSGGSRHGEIKFLGTQVETWVPVQKDFRKTKKLVPEVPAG